MKVHRVLKALVFLAILVYLAAGPMAAVAYRKPTHSPAALMKAPALVMKQVAVARGRIVRELGNEILDFGIGALKRAIEWWLNGPPQDHESAEGKPVTPECRFTG